MNDLFSNVRTMLIDNEDNLQSNNLENMKKIVRAVEAELKVAKESVFESIDISSINYVKSRQELDSLQSDISVLNRTIDSINRKIEIDLKHTKGASEIQEISFIKKEIDMLKKANIFFETISQLHSIFAEFDNYLMEYEFDLAADALSNANQKLNSIDFCKDNSSNTEENKLQFNGDCEDDKDILEEVRIEYLLRKGRLVSTVEKLFKYIFHFEGNEIKIRLVLPKKLLSEVLSNESFLVFDHLNSDSLEDNGNEEMRISLQDIWYALHSVEVVNEHVAFLSKQCIDNILNPLIIKGSKLATEKACEYKLTFYETRSHCESKWEYKVIPRSNKDGDNKGDKTAYEHIIPIIIALLKFITEDCLTGNIQVISLFGKCTWNWLSFKLLQGISPAPIMKDGQILRELEVQSRSLQIIPSSEDTITNYINQLETNRYEERKMNALCYAKDCIMSDDPSIVLVDDSTEIGSLTNLLQQCGVSKSKVDKTSDLSNIISLMGENDAGNASTGPFSSIQSENESFLRLSMCGVSNCTHLLIQKIHQILDEAITDRQKHYTTSAKQSYYLIRELVMLFILLRPTAHKEKLEVDPLFTATFYTDCTYLIHHLILIPFTYGNKFPPPLPQIGSFVDLLLTLRKLQETAISNLLNKEVTKINEMIVKSALSTDSIKNMSFDRTFMDAETIYVDIVQRLKKLSSIFSSTLPLQVYLQSFGSLVDETIRITLNQVLAFAISESVQDIQPDDASALVLLLNNVASQIQKLFEYHIFKTNNKETPVKIGVNISRLIYIDPPSLIKFLTYWDSLTILRDTLDADIATIVQQKEKLRAYFKPNEIRGILNLNPFLSSNIDEVYYIVISPD